MTALASLASWYEREGIIAGMAGFNASVLEAIGNTPIVELNRFGAGVGPSLLAKHEFTNPGGSMKDRAALGMIEWAEREYDLSAGSEIIISTSGNLGIGMAMICAVKGYRLICLFVPKLNPSTERSLELLGAELVKVGARDHTGGFHLTRLERLETLRAERPNAIYLDQYDSPAAIEAHRTSTGREILEQMGAQLDAMIMIAGTGVSSMGIARWLREHSPDTEIWLVDEVASLTLPRSARPEPLFLNGMGTSIQPNNYAGDAFSRFVDEVVYVKAGEAIATATHIARTKGIVMGGAGGAACHVMREHAAAGYGLGARLLALIPDQGSRYTQTQFDLEWLENMGISGPALAVRNST
ncbi:MAG: cysteine synthase family protein [Luminiphilus sp.]|nr:cysteine synthase family protein [Luminiphilus sp.]